MTKNNNIQKENFQNISEDEKISKQEENNNLENNSKKIVYKGYVGFWKRVSAEIIDIIIPTIFSFIITLIFFKDYVDFSSSLALNLFTNNFSAIINNNFFKFYILSIILTLVVMIYHIYLYYKNGQGIGYKALGFKIIDQKTGVRPTKKKLFMRFLYKNLFIILFFILFLFFSIKSFLFFINNTGAIYDYSPSYFILLIFGLLYILLWSWPLVIAISIGVSKNKRGLHDKFSKTIVVRERDIKSSLIWAINLGFVLLYIASTSFLSYRLLNSPAFIEYSIKNNIKIEKILEEKGDTKYFHKGNPYEKDVK